MIIKDQHNRLYTFDNKIALSYRVKDESINFASKKSGYHFDKYVNFYVVKKWQGKRYHYLPSHESSSLIEQSFSPGTLQGIILKDYQQNVINFCASMSKKGIVVSGEGTGKTIMMLSTALLLGIKTVIVVPSIAIAKGFVKTRKDYGLKRISLSVVTSSTFVESDIVIMTHVSFNKLYDKLNKKYGLLILDECDLLPEKRIEQLLLRAGKYFGFTATPKRKEFGLDGFSILFGQVYNTQQQSLPVKVYKYLYEHDYSLDEFSTYCSDLSSDSPEVYRRLTCNNNDRTLKLPQIINKLGFSRYIIFSDRTNHIEQIMNVLEDMPYELFQLDGSTNKEKFFENIKDSKRYIIVANSRSGGRGFDMPNIECGILFTSTSWENSVRQSSGRSRRSDGEKSVGYYVDFVDRFSIAGSKPKYLGRYERKKVYDQMGWPVINLDLNNIFDD